MKMRLTLGSSGRVALLVACALALIVSAHSAYARDGVYDDTFRICMKSCIEPCCREKCGYAACTTQAAARQMGGDVMSDPGAFDAAMGACQSRIGDIQGCANAYAEQRTRPGGGRGCELLIMGVLDDHYDSRGRYRMTVYVNGEVKFQDSASKVFSHGRPFGKIFSNWRTLNIRIPGQQLREGSLNVEFRHEGSAPDDWIAIDYMEVVCGGRGARTKVSEVNNYGSDGTAGLIYGGETKGWTVGLPGY